MRSGSPVGAPRPGCCHTRPAPRAPYDTTCGTVSRVSSATHGQRNTDGTNQMPWPHDFSATSPSPRSTRSRPPWKLSPRCSSGMVAASPPAASADWWCAMSARWIASTRSHSGSSTAAHQPWSAAAVWSRYSWGSIRAAAESGARMRSCSRSASATAGSVWRSASSCSRGCPGRADGGGAQTSGSQSASRASRSRWSRSKSGRFGTSRRSRWWSRWWRRKTNAWMLARRLPHGVGGEAHLGQVRDVDLDLEHEEQSAAERSSSRRFGPHRRVPPGVGSLGVHACGPGRRAHRSRAPRGA